MWKLLYLVILFSSDPILSKTDNVIDRVIHSLEKNLDYISQNYNSINVDCLFGVVLGGAILQEAEPGPYREIVTELINEIHNIYSKALPVVQKFPSWETFTKYIVVPELLPKPIKFKMAQFKTAYPKKSRVEGVLSEEEVYKTSSEGLTDMCIGSIINSTLDLNPQANCSLSPICADYVQKLNNGSGYFLTHKLLMLQIARARKCKMNPKTLAASVKKVCYEIYEEAISLDTFLGINKAFDLVIEQIILCGFEGYADFFKRDWLEEILRIQHKTGCFPIKETGKRKKREVNVWNDGCADHPTGLGTAVLSLYLNYLLENMETVSVIPGWE